MPNASELERTRQEELLAERTELLNSMPFIRLKKAKENVLRKVRSIEAELGIVGLPYNGHSVENGR